MEKRKRKNHKEMKNDDEESHHGHRVTTPEEEELWRLFTHLPPMEFQYYRVIRLLLITFSFALVSEASAHVKRGSTEVFVWSHSCFKLESHHSGFVPVPQLWESADLRLISCNPLCEGQAEVNFRPLLNIALISL